MKKVTLIAITTILAVLLFGISSFAANNIASDAVNGVRNVVGGAENAVEGAASGIANGVRNGMSAVGNTMENAGDTMKGSMTSDTNNGDYDATRTTTRSATTTRMGTNTGSATFLGMSATAWTWFVMAAVGILTIALVWYYGKERETKYSNSNNDNY